MIDVGIFGCSFTEHGFPSSWPKLLAEKNKNYCFWDHSAGSTSLLWSIQQMKEFKSYKPNSKVIFQITSPYRITNSIENSKQDRIRENYFKINKQYETVTPGKGNFGLTKRIEKLFDHIVLDFPREQWDTDYQILVDYIIKNTDFCFAHRDGLLLKDIELPIVENILGEKFSNYCEDYKNDDYHFNYEGTQWLADFVWKNFKWN